MEWKRIKLATISDSIQTGPFGSQLHQSDYSEIGTPVIMPKDMVGGILNEANIARIDDTHVQRLCKHKVKEGDIIYSRRGDVGRCVLITPKQENWICGTGCLKVSLKRNEVIPSFVFYLLQSSDSIGWIENHAVGATMPNLNTEILSNLPLSIPSFSVQQKIVSILSNYDTLIDLNTKRIKLLEESARELYKEWFVRMRFPGYENTKFVKGIPEGWSVKDLRDLVSTQYGLTTTAHSEKENNDAYYLRITDIVDNNIDWAKVPYCATDDSIMTRYKLYPGDILVARTGATVGYATQIQKIPFDAVFASYLIRLKAKNKLHILYIGMSVVSDTFRDYIQSIATGAAQPMANPHLMTSFKLFLPSDSLLEKFNEKIDLINDEILNLQLQNQELTATRDRLLPRLLSGELKVGA